jgi:hypothetical protein
MKRPLIDRIHDRLWTITGNWLDIKRPLPSVECIAAVDGSISGTMDWPRACAALASGALTSKNFRRIHAVRQVVETLGPVDGRHFARWIRDSAPGYLTDKRVAAIDAWGDPIRWPAACLGTPRAFSPTTLRFLAHALWLKKEGFVKEGKLAYQEDVQHGFENAPDTLKRLEGENRVVFRYAEGTNPNGALNDIAGIMNESGTVIGMMPHPETMIEPLHGKTDCRPLFESLLAA